MKIQCITTNSKLFLSELITYSSFSSPDTLDSYDINIIDLTGEYVWRNNDGNISNINIAKDLKNLSIMIGNSNKSTFIYLYPQNLYFRYSFNRENYLYKKELKNMLNNVCDILYETVGIPKMKLEFQNNKTNIKGILIDSSFHFASNTFYESIIKANDSDLTVAKKKENEIYTTLNIDNTEKLFSFLSFVGLYQNTNNAPEWIKEIPILNEIDIEKGITSKQQDIVRLKSEITNSEKELQIINKYKSILYESGDILENVVREMLSNMTGYDLSGFVDEKHEDFLIKLDDITFIGEIKGRDTNVRDSFLSQLEENYCLYIEKLEDEGKSENVKQILIIDYEIRKPVFERNPINQKQIDKAIRNNQLIIDSYSFLKLFEYFKQGKLNSKQIVKYFSDKIGLFNISEIQ